MAFCLNSTCICLFSPGSILHRRNIANALQSSIYYKSLSLSLSYLSSSNGRYTSPANLQLLTNHILSHHPSGNPSTCQNPNNRSLYYKFLLALIFFFPSHIIWFKNAAALLLYLFLCYVDSFGIALLYLKAGSTFSSNKTESRMGFHFFGTVVQHDAFSLSPRVG